MVAYRRLLNAAAVAAAAKLDGVGIYTHSPNSLTFIQLSSLSVTFKTFHRQINKLVRLNI